LEALETRPPAHWASWHIDNLTRSFGTESPIQQWR